MNDATRTRPAQATVAGWLVVAGSAVIVLTALQQAGALHSLDTREAVVDYLTKPPGDELGIGIEGGLTLLRVLTTVMAVVAAASTVLGWFALQRSKGARTALTVLAVPLFLIPFSFHGLVQGSVVPAMVAAAIAMLWFQPSRDWFNGVTRPVVSPAPAAERAPEPPVPAPTASSALPAAGGRDPLLDLPPPSAPPLHQTPYAAPRGALPTTTRRPAAVTWACVLAWLSTAAVFGILALVVMVVLSSPEAFLEAAHKANPELDAQGLTDADLQALTYLVCGIVMAWSAGAATLAVLTWRRVAWAAVLLAVSAGLASLLCLLTLIGALSVPFLVPLAACAATVALLLRPESQAWFRRSAPSRGRRG